MDKLRDFIQENISEFDHLHPSEGHFDQFRQKLMLQTSKSKPWYLNFRIAATLFFGILITGASYLILINQKADDYYAGLDKDIQETIYYYSSMSFEMEQEINQMNFESKQEKEKLFADIRQYDQNIKEVLEDLKRFPDDYRIRNALIEHFRVKTEFLEIIMNQIKL